MPIEFHCSQCGKLLRTPDGSAGQKARCPQCGTVQQVPAASTAATAPTAAGVRSEAPAAPPASSPFEPRPAPLGPTALNPYATPQPAALPKSGTVVGTPRQIEFQWLWDNAWQVLHNRLGPLLLLGLVVFGIQMGVQIVMMIVSTIVQATESVAAIVIFQVISFAISAVLTAFVSVGTAHFILNLLRRGDESLGNFFQVGSYFGRGLLLYLLQALIFAGLGTVGVALVALPVAATLPLENPAVSIVVGVIFGLAAFAVVVYFAVRLLPVYFFLVGHPAGVVDSVRLSWTYMQGNVLVTLLAHVVAFLIMLIPVVCTCFILSFAFVPIIGLLHGLIYLGITGQSFITAPRPHGAPAAPTALGENPFA